MRKPSFHYWPTHVGTYMLIQRHIQSIHMHTCVYKNTWIHNIHASTRIYEHMNT